MPLPSIRTVRLPALIACLLIHAAVVGTPSVLGQLPQARLTSLSRAGVRSGETAEITLRGSDLEGVTQLWFDHPGLRATHVKDLTFRVACGPDVPLGHHDLRAVGTFGVSNPRTFVVGDRPEAVEAEPNNTPDKATPIVSGSVLNGEISAATEIDCFAFEGKKGQRLFLDLHAERLDSPLDATLRVLTPSGTELAESRDAHGADPFLDVTLPADGRYIIKVHDAVYAGSADHIYRLSVHDGPYLDAVLPLAAQPDKTETFTLIGRGLGPDATADAELKAEGRALERVTVPFRAPGEMKPDPLHPSRSFISSTMAVALKGFEPAFTRTNPSGAAPATSNSVLIAEAAAPVVLEQEPNDDDARPQTVVPPCDISGTFGVPGDADVYRFQGKKGEVWRIEAFAERQGSPADPAIVIQKVGAKGQPSQDLASGDDLPDAGAGARFNTQSVDAALRWQVPEDGQYQVLISDLYSSQRGDPRLTYRLVIRREQPDFRLFLVPNSPNAIDAVTIRAGGRTSAYVMAKRLDDFSGPIRIEAAELPPGVRCAPVILGPGQVLVPIVFEAAEDAKTAIGTVSLIGRTRFGDRKGELGYVAGASSLGPDLVHPVLAGGMTRPANATVPTIAPARIFRGFVVAVRGEPAPLTLTAKPENWVVAQGHQLNLEMTATRRAGFVEAVAVTAPEFPPNVQTGTVTIAKDAKTAVLPLFVAKNVPPGTYSFVVRGAGAYPFSKDPNAKQKPNVNLTEPSNAVTVTVRPAPVNLTVNNQGGALKQGNQLEITVTLARQNGFAGPVSLALTAPAALKLSAAPVSLAKDQTQAKLILKAAADSPVGAAASVAVRAAAEVRGEPVEVDEPVAVTINK